MGSEWEAFLGQQLDAGATAAALPSPARVACYEDFAREYAALKTGAAIVDRSYRGVLELTGGDRSGWLQNLQTQDLRKLQPGEGCYGFALDLKGRILFDMNILFQQDRLLIDLDRRFATEAHEHLERHLITEDVQIANRSDDWVRLGVAGELSKVLMVSLGVKDPASLPPLGTSQIMWEGATILVIRHDFCGSFGMELLVPDVLAVAMWRNLATSSDSPPRTLAGDDAVGVRRIEAGIPWSLYEIDKEVLPAETGLVGRAVSFTKGCYLGQEVVERMRSRGVVARRLVGLRIDGNDLPPQAVDLVSESGDPVGRLTSRCHSPALESIIGLGYVKSGFAGEGTTLRVEWEAGDARAAVVELPSCERGVRDSAS